MIKEKQVFIPSGIIQLEGLLGIHEALPFKGGVIFCHPHPQFGGDMHNPVISAGVEVAFEEGFSTLRFNFRGVGESGGAYAEGIGEAEDVQAVVEYFCSELGRADQGPSLILAGYSFGAWTGLPVAMREERIQGMVAIAPPLEIYDFGFLEGCKKKKLIVAGNKGLHCPKHLLDKWFETLEEPKRLSVIQGADHFFFIHNSMLKKPLREFFKEF